MERTSHTEAGSSDPIELTVIVVSFNSRELIALCLRSVEASAAGITHEVVVVDNGSSDGSMELVRDRFPAVEAIEAGSNLGFARAANLAASRARGRLLLFVNPDAVVEPTAIPVLVDFARRSLPGLAGGRTVFPDGSPNPGSARGLPSLWSMVCFATGLSTLGRGTRLLDPESLGSWPRDTLRSVAMLSGAFLVVPRSIWDELGGFDPRYFMYFEDADLCCRAAQRGYAAVFVPDAVAVHLVGASSAVRRDKLILLLAGRVTYLRLHWRFLSPVGIALLQAGVALRALAARVRFRDQGDEGRGAWSGAWRDRRRWGRGYPLSERSERSGSGGPRD